MRRIYKRLKTIPQALWHTWLDYVYVGYWQAIGVIMRPNMTAYKNGRRDLPAVVLLPGIYERWDFMRPLADSIDKAGYRLFIVKELGYNQLSVEESAVVVREYLRTHDLTNYIFVAHSKGGLIGKLIIHEDITNSCKGMIAINTPFGGSKIARFFPLTRLKMFSPKASLIMLISRDKKVNARIVSVYSQFDQHVLGGSYLEKAVNVKVSARGHFKPIGSREVKDIVVNYLDILRKM